MLQAGQSSVTLDGQNITFACPGTFSVKGVGHAFLGAGSQSAELSRLPQGNISADLPTTPLEGIYSQSIDFSGLPESWLPFESLGETVEARAQGEKLTNLERSIDDTFTDGVLTKKSEKLDFWVGSTGRSWSIEESIFSMPEMAIEEVDNDTSNYV